MPRFAIRRSLNYPVSRQKGFTIIDILIVCAAIAILLQILLPLFGQARKVALRTQCVNNLHQFACAFFTYSQDWNDRWPCPDGRKGNYIYWAQTGNGGLQSYLPQRGVKSVWCCPTLDDWNGAYSPRSYSMNSYLRTPADVEYKTCCEPYYQRGICTNKIMIPKKTILLYEGQQADDSDKNLDYIYRCANWSCVSGYSEKRSTLTKDDIPRHGKYNNYLYCDGHVVSRPPGLWTYATLSTYSEMYEWYVDKGAYERLFTSTYSRYVPRN